ncbi:DMT family transporter [uncultured Shimia sp.]|uniref:DMT family transporter n=1 Tax=uncultured Shimia sp. TaxID=573152 RepID=UPI0025D317D1|nr:DMT family transporter [uncultured Shimia sp.]
MIFLPLLVAIGASFGWASGIVLAEAPAKQLGAFAFTRIQLIACALIVTLLVSTLGDWHSVEWSFWPAFVTSSVFGIVLGNLAMIACLRRGGPRRTELLLSMKAPVVGIMAFIWLNEIPTTTDLMGACIALCGVCLAIFFGNSSPSKSDAQTGKLSITILLGLTATTLQGYGFLAMKPALQAGLEPLTATAIRLIGAAVLISILAFWPGAAVRAQSPVSPTLLGRTILPGFIGYVVSSSLLLYAFTQLDAGIAAVFGSLSPVLILPILWWKDRQRPHSHAIIGALLTVLGTAVIALA